MPRRPLMIGEAPARTTVGMPAFSGLAGAFLLRACGVIIGRDVDAVNLLGRWHGRSGKGSAFPIKQARQAASKLDTAERPLVLLVGHRVAAAFGIRATYFEPTMVRGRPAFIVPHPSGVNRWWNAPNNRRRAAQFFQAILAPRLTALNEG